MAFFSLGRGSILQVLLFLLYLAITLICRMAITRKPRFNEFLIGRSNDRTGMDSLGIITVDDLKFWSEYKDEYQIREIGKSTAYNCCRRRVRFTFLDYKGCCSMLNCFFIL